MIFFRPHHFLCTYCFEGKGYSPEFVENYTTISKALTANPETKIKVVRHTDSICAPCPHKRGLLCETQAKIDALDEAHQAMLHLQENETLTWQEAKTRIKAHVTLAKFHQACALCSWKKFGICENYVQAL